MNKSFLYTLVVLFALSLNQVILSQDEHASETNWSVPELFSFHEIIYPIWHTAFPNKDTEMLISYVPQVNEGAEKIFNVKLPGILRDKVSDWEDGVANFKLSVDLYNKAAEEKNDKLLLDAAEKLHSDFEKLVRIIKPLSKEIDEFHKELYMVYHYYLPEKQIDKLKESSVELVKRAEVVVNTDTPKRIISKKEEYKTLVEALFQSADNLKIVLASDELEKIDSAVEDLHTKYQQLEKLFD